MRQRLFVYGTLQRDDILRAVIGFVPAGEPATLNGYRLVRLADTPWPVIRPAFARQVNGRVLTGLNRRHFLRVDRYEGKEYRRKRVRVCLPDGKRCHAWTYVGAGARAGAASGGAAWSNGSASPRRMHLRALLPGIRR